jgi:tRNA dimethylallyltransferase
MLGKKLKLIVVLGPTASGKSDLAIGLAKKFNGEIISADSRQVYRGMDIGTGKVPRDKKLTKFDFVSFSEYLYRGIPHYLLGVASPKRRFTVAQYKKLAQKAIKNILAKGKIPIICGGTGFYIDALLGNITISEVKPDTKMRAKLEKIATNKLYKLLQKLDSRRAKNIDRFNRRRLIRALEIIYKTGKPIPNIKNNPVYDVLYIGIKKSPQELKKLIAARLQKRLKQGMIAEVKKLRREGVSWKRLDDMGLEYRWVARFLQNKISREEMLSRLQKEIEHYAKRQMTWFNKNKKILWVGNKIKAENAVKEFLKD